MRRRLELNLRWTGFLKRLRLKSRLSRLLISLKWLLGTCVCVGLLKSSLWSSKSLIVTLLWIWLLSMKSLIRISEHTSESHRANTRSENPISNTHLYSLSSHIFLSLYYLQKARKRYPVSDRARVRSRHPCGCGSLLVTEEGVESADDRRVPGQQTEAVQPRCPGVSSLSGVELKSCEKPFHTSRVYIHTDLRPIFLQD